MGCRAPRRARVRSVVAPGLLRQELEVESQFLGGPEHRVGLPGRATPWCGPLRRARRRGPWRRGSLWRPAAPPPAAHRVTAEVDLQLPRAAPLAHRPRHCHVLGTPLGLSVRPPKGRHSGKAASSRQPFLRKAPLTCGFAGTPNGIRTRVATLKGRWRAPLGTAGTAPVLVRAMSWPLETAGSARIRCSSVASSVARS